MSPSNIMHNFARLLNSGKQSVPASNQHLPGTVKHRDAVLVIDASGSMLETDWEPSRLGAAQQAAEAFIRRLASEEPHARVAVVAYGTKAILIRKLTTVTSYDNLKQSIDSIQGMGTTSITAGLEIAWNLLRRPLRNGQVVLLSDSWHNGDSDPRPVSDGLKECAIVECIGIGGSSADVDEELY